MDKNKMIFDSDSPLTDSDSPLTDSDSPLTDSDSICTLLIPNKLRGPNLNTNTKEFLFIVFTKISKQKKTHPFSIDRAFLSKINHFCMKENVVNTHKKSI